MQLPPLIFFEGIPGTGKSTSAQRLFLHLENLNQAPAKPAARWCYEFDNQHPILTPPERMHLLESEDWSVQQICKEFLSRWNRLAIATAQQQDDQTFILDSAYYQLPVGVLILKNAAGDVVAEYLAEVEEILRPLSPLLIHFVAPNVGEAFRSTCELRAEDHFAEHLVQFVSATAYGVANEVTYVNDIVALLDFTQQIATTATHAAKFSTLMLEIDQNSWSERERQITERLGLPPIPAEISPTIESPSQYTGCYRATEEEELTINLSSDGQRIMLNGRQKLIAVATDSFMVEASCLRIKFIRDDNGVVQHFELSGPVEIPVKDWLKVTNTERTPSV